MISIGTLKQLDFARGYTLSSLNKSIDTEWDTQPKGYNNTIRWNAGHVFVSMEYFVSSVIEDYEMVHPEWAPFFATGSSPASWEGDAPSKEEIMMALKEQSARIIKAVEGNLEKTIVNPIKIADMTLENVETVVQFVIWHEGIHAGIISGLNRATAN